jgi:hypothetical protein
MCRSDLQSLDSLRRNPDSSSLTDGTVFFPDGRGVSIIHLCSVFDAAAHAECVLRSPVVAKHAKRAASSGAQGATSWAVWLFMVGEFSQKQRMSDMMRGEEDELSALSFHFARCFGTGAGTFTHSV